MATPWFTPGATTASWFPQSSPGIAAAASSSPPPSSSSSPFLSSIFGQTPQSQPGIGPAPAPQMPSGPDPANAIAGAISQYGRPIASALGSDYSRGLGGLLGLTNLGLGAANGNPVQAAGGGISALGGFSNLLASSPNLSSALGLGGLSSAGSGLGGMSALGSIGAGAGGLGGLLGIYGGIQGLMNGGNVPSGLLQLGSGLAGTYGALSSLLPSVFPSATAAIASAVPSLAPAIAGAAAAAGPAAMVAAPYAVAKLIQLAQAMGPDKANARQLGIRVQNIYGQLPGLMSQLQGIPNIAGQLTPGSTPEQAADILKQLNSIQRGYQEGGWESHQKTGVTQVQSVGEGNMEASFPQIQKALMDQAGSVFPYMDIARVRAQDVLGRAGWTPEQIATQTGRYIGPEEWAMNLGRRTYNSSEQGNLGSGGGPSSSAWNPWMQANYVNPSDAAYQSAVFRAQELARLGPEWEAQNAAPSRATFQVWAPGAQEALRAIQPGHIEEGLSRLFGGQFGDPAISRLGFGSWT